MTADLGSAACASPTAAARELPIYCLQPPRAVPAEVQARLHAPAPWDAFYALHGTGFFKDRNWLTNDCEFPELEAAVRVAEVGCGVGNTARPLARAATPPGRVVYASDFSATAIAMLAIAPEVSAGRLIAYVADAGVAGTLAGSGAANDPRPPPASLDAATLIFALSAMAPPQQAVAVANVASLLRKGGLALVRDYAAGDAAAARLASRSAPRELDAAAGAEEDVDEDTTATPPVTRGRFLARGDGTLAYFFPPAELRAMFERAGFRTRRCDVKHYVKTNRATGQVFGRAWVQGVFEWGGRAETGSTDARAPPRPPPTRYVGEWEDDADRDGDDDDVCVGSLFGGDGTTAAADLEAAIVRLPAPPGALTVRRAAGELRSTLTHTGLLAWPAAPALARALCSPAAAALLHGADVLEVGAGGSPLAALAAAARGARRVVATDGSPMAARLLSSNVAANAHAVIAERVRVARLEWGDAESVNDLVERHTASRGFSLVLGADVLYSPAATDRLMVTLAGALASGCGLAVLCHQTRRVGDDEATAAAAKAGLVVRPPPAGLVDAAAEQGVGDGKLLRLLCFEKKA